MDDSPPLPVGDYSRGVLRSMCPPFFPALRRVLGPYLVDKTKLIQNIVDNNRLTGHVDLVLRPRRCGKSTMLQMLKSFFSIPRKGDPEPGLLFKGLHIETREYIYREHMGKYPVIFLDFKNLGGESWDDMLSIYKDLVSVLYRQWEDCLMQSLKQADKTYFESICLQTVTEGDLTRSLYKLSRFLARKFNRGVIVLIDEYEAPIDCAFDHGYFRDANEFFGCGVLPALLKSNQSLKYAVLAGVTPAAKSGWCSGLNNLKVHALHTCNSIFAGMLMFTEPEVLQLKILSNSELELKDLKAHYNSYIAACDISVYNPVSVMSALMKSRIKNYWVLTGEYPLMDREFPEDDLDVIEDLLAGTEIEFNLAESVTFSDGTLSKDETLTLLYYAGYLTMTANDKFKIPNPEVMTDWVRWAIGDVKSSDDIILKMCVEGPVSDFAARWPPYMQDQLNTKHVGKRRGAISRKTPEEIYHVFFLGLMQSLRGKGWELAVEPRAGRGYADIRLLHKGKRKAVLIELKSSEKLKDMEGDADKALKQIVDKNYRNPEGLPNIRTVREYGIAGCHVDSCVKGRYLELNTQNQWVEKDDPVTSVS